MTSTLTLVGLKQTQYAVLKTCTENLRAVEKHSKRELTPPFESAFKVCGGPFRRQELHSPELSSNEDDDALSSSADDTSAGAAGGDLAKDPDTPTMRDVYGSTLISLCEVIEAQAELATHITSPAVCFTTDLMKRSRESSLTAVRNCWQYVYNHAENDPGDPLMQPANQEALSWASSASEVHRRTQALLAWMKLKDAGSDAARSSLSRPPPPLPPSAVPAVAAASAAVPTTPSMQKNVQSPTPVALPSCTGPRGRDDGDDDDGGTHLDARWVLRGFQGVLVETDEDQQPAEIVFNPSQTTAVAVPPPPPPQAEKKPLFDPRSDLGRRSVRAMKLRNGVLQQTDEPLTEWRLKLIQQAPTLRDLMSIFGKSDYNIVAYQLRTNSQQIGESGPLLWTAALDVCISDNFEDEPNPRRRWMEERSGNEAPSSSDADKYKWVVLVQSDPCIRGGSARTSIISMAACLLFPREFEHYRDLGRDDVVMPDDDSDEWQCVRNRTVGVDAPLGPKVAFVLDRSSFVTQAFRWMERLRQDVGNLRIDITEERSLRPSFSHPTQVDAYVVSVFSGYGTLLVKRSSREIIEKDEQERVATVAGTGEGTNVSTSPAEASLVPTLFDALYYTAEKLGVLDTYLQLEKSFDRIRLPVANEAREYALNYVSLVFGMYRTSNGELKDAVDFTETSVPGGWNTAIRISYIPQPTGKESNLQHVQLGNRDGNTKKAARSATLMYLGKTNFTVQMLRMMEYGTALQKVHAETILMIKAAGVIPLQSPLRRQMKESEAFICNTETSLASKAPGASVSVIPSRSLDKLSLCDRLISKSIERHLSSCVGEMGLWLTQVYPGADFHVQWDDNVMGSFLATLSRDELSFGQYVFRTLEKDRLEALNSLVASSCDGHRVCISGQSPLFALYVATRQLRDRWENAMLGAPTTAKKRKAERIVVVGGGNSQVSTS
jgi:hypothetical protein